MEKTQAHTPGPWLLHVDEQLRRAYVYTAEPRTIYVDGRLKTVEHQNKIADINPDGNIQSSVVSLSSHTHDIGAAYLPNAHLIAAAPDLLEACTHALAVCEAEAELRGDNDADDYAGGAAGPVADMLRAAIAKAEGGAA